MLTALIVVPVVVFVSLVGYAHYQSTWEARQKKKDLRRALAQRAAFKRKRNEGRRLGFAKGSWYFSRRADEKV